jgi:hypothetical protein
MEIEKNKQKILTFAKYLFIASSIAISFINYGSLESILITRNICIVIVIIASIIIILLQVQYNPSKNKIVNISLIILFIIILISYIYYINKSYTIDKTTSILNNIYSNYFILLFVLLGIYLSYYLSFEMDITQYCTLLVFCSVMICLLYPLMISIIYYKTDGFKNIYN